AFDADEGIISPGGIGYDINCGVRLIRTNVDADDLDRRAITQVLQKFYDKIPPGVGRSGGISLSIKELKKLLTTGADWAIKRGYGSHEHLVNIEEGGVAEGADPNQLSERALSRGRDQLGTLGAGNHFLEVQKVTKVYDKKAAEVFGLEEGKLAVMIHTGSRGLGYQVCDDYLKVMQRAVQKYKINISDRQLACAPFKSDEGQRYFSAMKCAANYAWANRQLITGRVIDILEDLISENIQTGLVYDVSHNIGRVEEHSGSKLVVHRKGATRSFGPSRKELPAKFSTTGQPVIVPGTMGTASYVMKATDRALKESFGSTCHGAGREMSRKKASGTVNSRELIDRLDAKGIVLKARSLRTAVEEAPEAYKDIYSVVDVCHHAGLSEKVARVEPMGVVKG
ncbi:MAG: RtcB family protein, partial [Elusimicrobia bacterium]|nr:RtcB family protein [Elusimicrobiota bacterium]